MMIKTAAKKIISMACVVSLSLSLFACASADADSDRIADGDRVTIGVSIWNTDNLLGKRTKRMIDETAEALGVNVIYFEHDYDRSMLRTSVNKLCAAGCDGILFCPNENKDMKDAIKTCDREGVYLVQYYSRIDETNWPKIYEMSVDSDHYVGSVYEDEVENGYNLTYYLLNNGDRQIGIMCSENDEGNFDQRRHGCEMAIEEWNNAHPEDTAHLSQTVYATSSGKSCNKAVDELLLKMRDMDGLVVGSGSATQVVGAMGALSSHGLTSKVDLVGTGFLDDMQHQLNHNGVYAESGGNICDALYAFLLVYSAIRGDIEVSSKTPGYEICCPYIYISSSDEYTEYEDYFINNMPYSHEEIRDLAKYSPQELIVAADTLSIRDVKTRHGRYVKEGKKDAGFNGKDNGKG